MTSIGELADELLETIAKEDEEYFQRHGFYTTRTRANECKVLVFEIPNEQKRLEDFNIWRENNGN
jgi:hypothetical protein